MDQPLAVGNGKTQNLAKTAATARTTPVGTAATERHLRRHLYKQQQATQEQQQQ